MLSEFRVHPSLATADAKRARAWYAAKLGLEPVREWEGQLVYSVPPTIFTVYETPSAGTARHTVMVWHSEDLRADVARLRARDLVFEDLDFGPGDRTVDGIMETAIGDERTLNAWFRDSDDNWISVVQSSEPDPEHGVTAMLAASDLGRARSWYAEKLGLVPYREYQDELLIYRAGLTRLSVYATPSAGSAKNTVAVWRVADLRAEVADLRTRGVVFADYDFGDVRTVDGILTDPEDGSRNAWFTDSEGNILSLAEGRGDLLP